MNFLVDGQKFKDIKLFLNNTLLKNTNLLAHEKMFIPRKKWKEVCVQLYVKEVIKYLEKQDGY